ncbi:MAG TPA: AAA family ATPase [Ruminococcus flavefaciens]|nr:AAA family ATPase [Ruminococcus flavefaciens]
MREQMNCLFYCEKELAEKEKLKIICEKLEDFSVATSNQVYFLNQILGSKKEYHYSINDVAVLLCPKHPIYIINYGDYDESTVKDYIEDIILDLNSLSQKFDYDKVLGRSRSWKKDEWFKIITNSDFNIDSFKSDIVDEGDIRKISLIISLMTGSINDINRVGEKDPQTLLSKVKQKIMLFDGQQSRFIYQDKEAQKRIVIQGLAGTGKTELLLHKLKETYEKNSDKLIVFTCKNKVLANKTKEKRIPDFFTFMHVDEQIDWKKRLHAFQSWGSARDASSGLISSICNHYKLRFITYGEEPDFELVCAQLLEWLNEDIDFEPYIDYLFVDESQDFGHQFIKLCEKITKEKVYLAGDVFQVIFKDDIKSAASIEPDFLLNQCYRTDPRTLMFAHAVEMGLYESPMINVLNEDTLVHCGYSVKHQGDKLLLSRSPILRFEDLQITNSMEIISSDNYYDDILQIIESIKNENEDLLPGDIAIIHFGAYKDICVFADKISYEISDRYNWKVQKDYMVKETSEDELFITNPNNIKGLEFPFIICVYPQKISDSLQVRNQLYMALTRSFITSYLIIGEKSNEEFISIYKNALDEINNEKEMCINNPENSALGSNHSTIISGGSDVLTLRDIIEQEMNGFNEQINDESLRQYYIEAVLKHPKLKNTTLSENDQRDFIRKWIGIQIQSELI